MRRAAAAVMAFLGCLALRVAFAGAEPPHHEENDGVPAAATVPAPPTASCNRYETITLATKDLESDVRASLERTNVFIDKCSDDAQIRELNVRAHLRLGETREAMAEADEMVRLEPTDPALRITHGELNEQLGRDDQAAADYREALRLNPVATNAPLKLATVYVRQGRSCDAAQVLKRAIDLHPSAEGRRPYVERLTQIQCVVAKKSGR